MRFFKHSKWFGIPNMRGYNLLRLLPLFESELSGTEMSCEWWFQSRSQAKQSELKNPDYEAFKGAVTNYLNFAGCLELPLCITCMTLRASLENQAAISLWWQTGERKQQAGFIPCLDMWICFLVFKDELNKGFGLVKINYETSSLKWVEEMLIKSHLVWVQLNSKSSLKSVKK